MSAKEGTGQSSRRGGAAEPLRLGAPSGAVEVLGVRGVLMDAETVVAQLQIDETHLNARGSVQGGIYAVVADAAAGWATEAIAGASDFTTIALSGNLIGSAVLGDTLIARARVIHAGRRTGVSTVSVAAKSATGAAERPVATFHCTQLILATQHNDGPKPELSQQPDRKDCR